MICNFNDLIVINICWAHSRFPLLVKSLVWWKEAPNRLVDVTLN